MFVPPRPVHRVTVASFKHVAMSRARCTLGKRERENGHAGPLSLNHFTPNFSVIVTINEQSRRVLNLDNTRWKQRSTFFNCRVFAIEEAHLVSFTTSNRTEPPKRPGVFHALLFRKRTISTPSGWKEERRGAGTASRVTAANAAPKFREETPRKGSLSETVSCFTSAIANNHENFFPSSGKENPRQREPGVSFIGGQCASSRSGSNTIQIRKSGIRQGARNNHPTVR